MKKRTFGKVSLERGNDIAVFIFWSCKWIIYISIIFGVIGFLKAVAPDDDAAPKVYLHDGKPFIHVKKEYCGTHKGVKLCTTKQIKQYLKPIEK
jgi:hypothetical protein